MEIQKGYTKGCLTVISDGIVGKFFTVRCDCGNVYEMRKSALIYGNAKYCMKCPYPKGRTIRKGKRKRKTKEEMIEACAEFFNKRKELVTSSLAATMGI